MPLTPVAPLNSYINPSVYHAISRIENAMTSQQSDPLSQQERVCLHEGLELMGVALTALMRLSDAMERLSGPAPSRDPLDGL